MGLRAMDENDKGEGEISEHGPLFAELRQSIVRHTQSPTRERLLTRLDHIEKSVNTSAFGHHVQALIEEAEEDAAAIAPFMSRLSSLLP